MGRVVVNVIEFPEASVVVTTSVGKGGLEGDTGRVVVTIMGLPKAFVVVTTPVVNGGLVEASAFVFAVPAPLPVGVTGVAVGRKLVDSAGLPGEKENSRGPSVTLKDWSLPALKPVAPVLIAVMSYFR